MDLPIWSSNRPGDGVLKMMGLHSRSQIQPHPFNVIVVLCLWILVGGLAWADSIDLSDDVGMPHASSGVIVDPDGDEVREKLDAAVRTTESLSGQMPPLTMPQLSQVLFSNPFVARSQNPLYQRLCSLRI
jgi:hypothetical protein